MFNGYLLLVFIGNRDIRWAAHSVFA